MLSHVNTEKIKISKNSQKNGHHIKKKFFNTQKTNACWFNKKFLFFVLTYSLLLMSKFAL